MRECHRPRCGERRKKWISGSSNFSSDGRSALFNRFSPLSPEHNLAAEGTRSGLPAETRPQVHFRLVSNCLPLTIVLA